MFCVVFELYGITQWGFFVIKPSLLDINGIFQKKSIFTEFAGERQWRIMVFSALKSPSRIRVSLSLFWVSWKSGNVSLVIFILYLRDQTEAKSWKIKVAFGAKSVVHHMWLFSVRFFSVGSMTMIVKTQTGRVGLEKKRAKWNAAKCPSKSQMKMLLLYAIHLSHLDAPLCSYFKRAKIFSEKYQPRI